MQMASHSLIGTLGVHVFGDGRLDRSVGSDDAVGALHLVGEKGLISQLRTAGFKVEPVN